MHRGFKETRAAYTFCSTTFSNTVSILSRSKRSFSFFTCFFLNLEARSNWKRRDLVFEPFYFYHFWLQIVELDPITRNLLPFTITQFPVHELQDVHYFPRLGLIHLGDLPFHADKRRRTQQRWHRLQTASGLIIRRQGRDTEFPTVLTSKHLLLRSTKPLVITESNQNLALVLLLTFFTDFPSFQARGSKGQWPSSSTFSGFVWKCLEQHPHLPGLLFVAAEYLAVVW